MEEHLGDNVAYIRANISEPAMYEQLAEEAAEVTHAALKLARIIRGENPTPKEYPEAFLELIEELTDLKTCMDILNLSTDDMYEASKINRTVKRLQERES